MAANFEELKARYDGVLRDGLLHEIAEMQIKAEDWVKLEDQIERHQKSAQLLEQHLEEKDQQLLLERRRREVAEDNLGKTQSALGRFAVVLLMMARNCPHCGGSGRRAGSPEITVKCGYCVDARALSGL